MFQSLVTLLAAAGVFGAHESLSGRLIDEETSKNLDADDMCSLSASVIDTHILYEKPEGRDLMHTLPRGSVLVEAWYGCPGYPQRGKNVTAKAQQLLGQGLPLAASNALWGDPAKFREKVLMLSVLSLEDHTIAVGEANASQSGSLPAAPSHPAVGASTGTCAMETSSQNVTWTRILACGGPVDHPLSAAHIQNMAWNATQVKICSLGNSTDCVVSKPNAFPIENLRKGEALSHKHGKPCGAACVAETWSGVRTAHLWAKCGGGPHHGALTGDGKFFWACGNVEGLHLSVAADDDCTWNWSVREEGGLEVFINTMAQPPPRAFSLPARADTSKKLDADGMCSLSAGVITTHILMEKPKGRDLMRALPRGSMLVHAWYGNPGNRQQGKNVTAKAQQLLGQGSPLAASNALWGDPAKNHEKVLVLCLEDRTIAAGERARADTRKKLDADGICSLSAGVTMDILMEKPAGRDLLHALPRGSVLVHAWYGNPGNRQQGKNVTAKAQHLLGQGSPLAASNALWGDPAFLYEKVLVLCLRRDSGSGSQRRRADDDEAAAECRPWKILLGIAAGLLVGVVWKSAGEALQACWPMLAALVERGGGRRGCRDFDPVVHIYWDRDGGCLVRRVVEVECPGVREEDIELEELANGVGITMLRDPRPGAPKPESICRPWKRKFFVDPDEGRFEIASPEEITLEGGVLRVVLTKTPHSRKFKLSSQGGPAVAAPCDSDADSDGVVSWSWSSSMDDATVQ